MLDVKKTIAKILSTLKVVQAGSVTITNVTTTENSVSVIFPKAYNSAPTVVACFSTASYNRRLHVSNVTATGFTVTVALNSGSGTASCWVDWIAVGGVVRKLLKALKSLTSERGWAVC